MFYNAKNENIKLDGTDCDYISFGTGEENLIMLPGVGDGFKTARGVAVPFAFMYSGFAKKFKVYVFSRRNNLPDDFSTAELAIRHPDRVKKLVLAVTVSRPNNLMKEALESWIKMADNDDYAGIMLDTAKRSYTGKYLERGIKMNGLLARMKPKDYTRFKILCDSCLRHDVYDRLSEISCPTFIVGADKDLVLGGEASVEMHERINGSTLYMYEGFSHGVYEQAKDFNDRVIDYLKD